MLIDDHPATLLGLKMYLGSIENVEIFPFQEVNAEQWEALENGKYDLIVSDYRLENDTGGAICRKVKTINKAIKTILISGYAEEQVLMETLNSDIDGFVLKNSSLTEFKEAIHTVMEGEKYLPPIFESDQYQEILDTIHLISDISNREKEVIELMLKGQKNQAIANQLFLSPKTIENHKKNLKEKLRLGSSLELMNFCNRYHHLIFG